MSSDPSPSQDGQGPRRVGRYLAILAAATAIGLSLIVAFNLVMDPYAVWRMDWPGINQARPWLHTDDAPIVTVAVHRPQAVVLGNSQVATAFDPRGAAMATWGRPLVISHESTTYDFETQVLEAASRQPGFRLALVEIDQRQLKLCRYSDPPVVAAAAIARLLSLSALSNSVMVLKMSLGADLSGRAPAEYQSADGLVVPRWRTQADRQLASLDYPAEMFGGVEAACADQADRRLRALADLARRRHFTLAFFVVPTRQNLLRLSWQEGYWPRLEALRRRLAGLAGETGVPVWDFSTAALHPQSGVSDLDFYDNLHFRPALGNRLLLAMRPGAPDLTAFAVRLTPGNVDAVLAADRQAIARLESGAAGRRQQALSAAPR